MTSSADPSQSAKALRKRRRACDACHKRKVRCDGIQQGQTACTYCLKSGRECTFESTPRKWPPSKNYVGGLEARVEHLERLLANIAPWPSSSQSLPWDEVGAQGDSTDADLEVDEDSDDDTRNEFFFHTKGFEDLRLVDNEKYGDMNDIYIPDGKRLTEPRFFHGRTSHFMVVRQLHELLASRAPEERKLFLIRPEFTRVAPNTYFESADISDIKVAWPDPVLASQLIEGYFEKVNPGIPLLHKATFLRQWSDPANHHKREWAALAFSVFAVGAKTLDDPRTKAWPDDKFKHSAGLPYWFEMRRIGYPAYAPPTLIRLQTLVLGALAIMGTPLTPSAGWSLIGLASRLAQDAGIHRKSNKRARVDPFEYEMRKRVFWSLFAMDRTMASFLDRPLAFREEDYDVELPLELDDEQLDNLQFGRKVQQKPCLHMGAWIFRLRLLQISSRSLATLYAARNTERPDLAEWERVILINLSSSLNSLSEMLPDQLKFDPDTPDDNVYLHTGLVNLQYQLTQILVYRPFLASAKLALHEDVPSSAVCSGAARAIAHTLGGLYSRNLLSGRTLETGLASFSAGTLLLMDMWQRREADSIDEVEKCLATLSVLEQTWQLGGMVRDVLTGLLELTKTALYKTAKRRKNVEGGAQDVPPSTISAPPPVQPQTTFPKMENIEPLAFDPTIYDPMAPMAMDMPTDAGPDFLSQIFGTANAQFDEQMGGAPRFPFVGDEVFDSNFTDWLSAMLGASQATPPDNNSGSSASDASTVVTPAPPVLPGDLAADSLQGSLFGSYQGNYGLF